MRPLYSNAISCYATWRGEYFAT